MPEELSMTPTVEQIANAVHYGGYTLYPYQSSAVKNRRDSFIFGKVCPKDFSESPFGDEPCVKQTECLLHLRSATAELEITVRFLQSMWRDVGYVSTEQPFRALPELEAGGRIYQTRLEATERRITISLKDIERSQRVSSKFAFPAVRLLEPFGGKPTTDGSTILRRQEAVEGEVEAHIEVCEPDTIRLSVRILNHTPMRPALRRNKDEVLLRTFASTHTILQASGADFISMMEPPARLAGHASRCKNIGTWPVLIGNDVMLSSPIILCDYPPIVPESLGEIAVEPQDDEMRALRVLTTESDAKTNLAAEVPDVTEMWTEEENSPRIEAANELFSECTPLRNVLTQGRELRAGDTVRVRASDDGAIVESKLAGKLATIETIEEDGEGRVLLGLVFENEVQSLGWPGLAGDRLFFGLDEIEVPETASVT